MRLDFLSLVMALMAFMATLALGAVVTVDAVTKTWSRGLTGQATVEIPYGQESAPTLLALTRAPGVLSARRLTDKEMQDLLSPWIDPVEDSFSLPILIAVELASDADTAAIAKTLPSQARLETHQDFLAQSLAPLYQAKTFALTLFGAVLAGTLSAILAAARVNLILRAAHIELFYALGAKDSYIARHMARQGFWMCLIGGGVGTGAALLTLGLMGCDALVWMVFVPLVLAIMGYGSVYGMVWLHVRRTL